MTRKKKQRKVLSAFDYLPQGENDLPREAVEAAVRKVQKSREGKE